MSIFIPYTPTEVLDHLLTLYSLDFSQLSSYETVMITLVSNIYFFIYWYIVIYFSLKIFNRIWERFL